MLVRAEFNRPASEGDAARMGQKLIDRLLDEYTAALAEAEASGQAVSELADRIVPEATPAATFLEEEDGAEHLANFGSPTATPGQPTLSEIRTVLANWYQARREVRKTYIALKATGSARVPKAPTLRCHDIWVLKRAAGGGSSRSVPPYSTALYLPVG